MIAVERVDHIGIRVRDLDRALNFYRLLGFELLHQADGDNVAIIRNENCHFSKSASAKCHTRLQRMGTVADSVHTGHFGPALCLASGRLRNAQEVGHAVSRPAVYCNGL